MSAALVFGIQVAMLCSLVVYLSALLAVHLEATVPQWLDSTYGFMLVRVVVHPPLCHPSLTQCGGATACRRPHPQHRPLVVLLCRDLRPFPRLLLVCVPRTASIAAAPADYAHTAHAAVPGPDYLPVDHVVQGAPDHFPRAAGAQADSPAQPFPCAADLALCCSLVPLALYELRQLPSLFVVGCALAVAFTMHPVLLDLWVERYTGNANFVLATTIVHALALTTLVVRTLMRAHSRTEVMRILTTRCAQVDVASVSTSRGGARHKKTL